MSIIINDLKRQHCSLQDQVITTNINSKHHFLSHWKTFRRNADALKVEELESTDFTKALTSLRDKVEQNN